MTEWLNWGIFLISLGAFLVSGALSLRFAAVRSLFLLGVNPGFLSGSVVGFFVVRSWETVWYGLLPTGIVVLFAFVKATFAYASARSASPNHGGNGIAMVAIATIFGSIAISLPYALAGTIVSWQARAFPVHAAGYFLVHLAFALLWKFYGSTKPFETAFGYLIAVPMGILEAFALAKEGLPAREFQVETKSPTQSWATQQPGLRLFRFAATMAGVPQGSSLTLIECDSAYFSVLLSESAQKGALPSEFRLHGVTLIRCRKTIWMQRQFKEVSVRPQDGLWIAEDLGTKRIFREPSIVPYIVSFVSTDEFSQLMGDVRLGKFESVFSFSRRLFQLIPGFASERDGLGVPSDYAGPGMSIPGSEFVTEK